MQRRRTALGIGLVLLICGCLRFLFFPLEQPGMGEQVLTEQEARELLDGRTAVDEELLPGLLFAGEELPLDVPSGTFYLPVDMEEKAWERGAFYASGSGVEVYLLDNPLEDNKQEAVRAGKSYRLLAVSGGVYRSADSDAGHGLRGGNPL